MPPIVSISGSFPFEPVLMGMWLIFGVGLGLFLGGVLYHSQRRVYRLTGEVAPLRQSPGIALGLTIGGVCSALGWWGGHRDQVSFALLAGLVSVSAGLFAYVAPSLVLSWPVPLPVPYRLTAEQLRGPTWTKRRWLDLAIAGGTAVLGLFMFVSPSSRLSDLLFLVLLLSLGGRAMRDDQSIYSQLERDAEARAAQTTQDARSEPA